MSKRAERRHHEQRIKARFRRRAYRWLRIVAWTDPVDPAEVEEIAVRKAHHPGCSWGACTRPRYDRRRDAPIDPRSEPQ